MVVGRRPKRHNPQAERLTFTAEIDKCPRCGEPLTSKGSAAHSAKTVQTLEGEFYVVAYSRLCPNPECENQGKHYHTSGHLKISLPYSTYGLDVVALVGRLRERQQRRFSEIQTQLNNRGVQINERSVGRLYRLFLALVNGTWPQRQARLEKAVREYGGLILMADGLQADSEGPTLYVLYEVLSSTPLSAVLIDKADTPHLIAWLSGVDLGDFPVLATISDEEKALIAALKTVWSEEKHQACQLHFLKNLSEPVHDDDQALRQTLKESVGQLPGVPTLELEEASKRIEHLVAPQEQGEPGKKGAWRPTTQEMNLQPRGGLTTWRAARRKKPISFVPWMPRRQPQPLPPCWSSTTATTDAAFGTP